MTATETRPDDIWPSSGFQVLQRNARGWLMPGDDYLRLFLARPELALVEESCPAETALHQALGEQPRRAVTPAELATLADADVRGNYRHFLAFRDALLAAGTLEAWYLGALRAGIVDLPPLFLDLVTQACVQGILGSEPDPLVWRAAELLFRPQRIHVQDGQVLCGDRAVLDMLNETGGLGDLGRLLTQGKAPLRDISLEVLGDGNAARYWQQAERHDLLLDLTHEITNNLSHGLVLRMARARSGLKALAQVLERWVAHFMGVQVSIQPEASVADAQWRWHVGLDAESSALLNDLYLGVPVPAERMQRLVSLFRLTFNNPLEMRADVAGKPVYLGLGMTADRALGLKPQNLLLNLPLRAAH
jgi:hypothetical protein